LYNGLKMKNISRNIISIFAYWINLWNFALSRDDLSLCKAGPRKVSVFDMDLVTDNQKLSVILSCSDSFHDNTTFRKYDFDVLGFVTPWNNHGYDIAKTFSTKFTHISPVWLQIKRTSNKNYDITGTHDVDKGWIKTVRSKNELADTKVVPRLLFDGWSRQDFSKLFSGNEMDKVIKIILKTCKLYKFDGIVLEIWMQLQGQATDHLIKFIQNMGKSFHDADKKLILVIPPPVYAGNVAGIVRGKHIQKLKDYVDSFVLMTYDYSSFQRPGANSPINWVKKCVELLVPNSEDQETRSKILLGLNFYGYDFTPDGGKHVLGNDYKKYLKLATKNNIIVLDYQETSKEHFLTVKDEDGKHTIYYPTLHSIYQRLELARSLGTGVSIWELGQGLDYFYDLF